MTSVTTFIGNTPVRELYRFDGGTLAFQPVATLPGNGNPDRLTAFGA